MTIPGSHVLPAARRAGLAAGAFRRRMRRVEQTVRSFTNWAQILGRLGGGRRLSDAVTFRTRTGLVITCPNVPGARVPVYEIFAEDCYRLPELLGSSGGHPTRVVDVGAHVGAFACELARLAPHAEIYCFEPSPVTAGYLQRNVMANGLSERIHLTQAAVAARAGEAMLVDNGAGSALNNLVMTDERMTLGVAVTTTTFDVVIGQLGGAQLVKIDCEGGEYDLVLASSPDSWREVRGVVIEYHPHPRHHWDELRRWFADVGLMTTRVEPASAEQGTAWLARTDVVAENP